MKPVKDVNKLVQSMDVLLHMSLRNFTAAPLSKRKTKDEVKPILNSWLLHPKHLTNSIYRLTIRKIWDLDCLQHASNLTQSAYRWPLDQDWTFKISSSEYKLKSKLSYLDLTTTDRMRFWPQSIQILMVTITKKVIRITYPLRLNSKIPNLYSDC
jgi:hypothetical protein